MYFLYNNIFSLGKFEKVLDSVLRNYVQVFCIAINTKYRKKLDLKILRSVKKIRLFEGDCSISDLIYPYKNF